MEFDDITQMWFRPGQDHKDMIWEARRGWAAAAPRPGDSVLDLGAHVGGFCVWAARDCGASRVVGVEPAPDTFEVLSKNAEGVDRLEIVHAAAVSGTETQTDLWLTKKHEEKGSCMASVIESRGRTAISVPAINIDALMQDVRPDVLKIDTEGSEFLLGIDRPGFLDGVHTLACEIHLQKKDHRDNAIDLINRIEEDFNIVSGERRLLRKPRDFGSYWAVNGVWRRKP